MNQLVSGLTVTLESPITISNNIVVNEIIITKVIDEIHRKKAIAICYNYKPFVLWEGNSYDDAGQWTDTDVINRVKQIITNS